MRYCIMMIMTCVMVYFLIGSDNSASTRPNPDTITKTGFGNESITLSASLYDDVKKTPVTKISSFDTLRLNASVGGINANEWTSITYYNGTPQNPGSAVSQTPGPFAVGTYSFFARAMIYRTDGASYGPINSNTVTITVVPVIIEADIVDEPPACGTYASGVNLASIVLKVNGIQVSPTITNIQYGYHLKYEPTTSQIFSGTNTYSIRCRDLANAGAPEGANKNDYGNSTDPDPLVRTFTLP
jgi:hypothetical protein